MVDMGAEVGQKMRSAIKAKLTELDCYVDDELPDYIMVMVANKRTKGQMNEDLNLFLNAKTATFVEWLHIVLKKLKEVTVTNLEVYKKASKRKSSEPSDVKVKKEKKIRKEKSKIHEETIVKQEMAGVSETSLTDNLPLNVKNFSENRKIVVVSNMSLGRSEDTFSLPTLSEVDQSSIKQLEEIEKQIKTVKDRLGLKNDQEFKEAQLRQLVDDRKVINNVNDPAKVIQEIVCNGRQIEVDISKTVELFDDKKTPNEIRVVERSDLQLNIEHIHPNNKKKEHSRITFSASDFQSPHKLFPKKRSSALDRLGNYEGFKTKSILERLGSYNENKKRDTSRERENKRENRDEKLKSSHRKSDNVRYSRLIERSHDEYKEKRKHDSVQITKRENDFKTQNSLRRELKHSGSSSNLKKDFKKRLGLSSKVTIPQIDPQLLEDTFKQREVVSVVKVKPRTLPPNIQQANKTLLLKAVAEAQKSIAQSKSVGNNFKEYSSSNQENQETDNSLDAHYSKHRTHRDPLNVKRISSEDKEKLKLFLSHHRSVSSDILEAKEEEEQKYIPKPIKRTLSNVEYVPSSIPLGESEDYIENKQKFIVTLDGIQKMDTLTKTPVKERLHGRKTPSPIIFENNHAAALPKVLLNTEQNKIPKVLPIAPAPSTKTKEKCKYFPFCKNGERCEYFHPFRNCEQFPYCKFGENCMYIHPNCKFGTSCTRRACLYSHATGIARNIVPVTPVKHQLPQICKFFPMCTNIKCSFYHPNPCKFGKYCKNQSVCNYAHSMLSKGSLTWKSNKI